MAETQPTGAARERRQRALAQHRERLRASRPNQFAPERLDRLGEMTEKAVHHFAGLAVASAGRTLWLPRAPAADVPETAPLVSAEQKQRWSLAQRQAAAKDAIDALRRALPRPVLPGQVDADDADHDEGCNRDAGPTQPEAVAEALECIAISSGETFGGRLAGSAAPASPVLFDNFCDLESPHSDSSSDADYKEDEASPQ